MFNVNIYLETSISGPSVKEAAGVWWVECVTGRPEPDFNKDFRRGYLWKGKTTENALTLELLRDALFTLTKPCSIRVNTQCVLIVNAMKKRHVGPMQKEKSWAERWSENGWINAKRKPVNHADLWQQVCGRLGMHMAGFDSWQNPYRDKMREGLEIVLASRGQEDPWKDLRKK